jgi:hypothetical protein
MQKDKNINEKVFILATKLLKSQIYSSRTNYIKNLHTIVKLAYIYLEFC